MLFHSFVVLSFERCMQNLKAFHYSAWEKLIFVEILRSQGLIGSLQMRKKADHQLWQDRGWGINFILKAAATKPWWWVDALLSVGCLFVWKGWGVRGGRPVPSLLPAALLSPIHCWRPGLQPRALNYSLPHRKPVPSTVGNNKHG